MLRRKSKPNVERVQITGGARAGGTVDTYWGDHTVNSAPFKSTEASEHYLEWRFQEYPLYREFADLWGAHEDEVVLDFGCGPGDDVVGLLLHSGARHVIGIDVSRKALELAADRVLLHGIDPVRVQLIQSSDLADEIPLPDASVNYVHTSGVLHHTSKPAVLLRELARVLKPGGRGCVMVYNRDSLWFHLFTAYERMIVEGAFPGSDVLTAFRMNTDGSGCPISRCFTVDEFTALVDDAGLTAEYVGGYLSKQELTSLEHSWARALADDRLGPEHRAFLRHLRFDFRGFPMHNGVHAGIGGVYRLRKPSP